MLVFLSIFLLSIGEMSISFFSFNFVEKILSLIVSFVYPFGPLIIIDPFSDFLDESFGIIIFFFPIFDIKILYKLFLHLYCFF